MEWLFNKFVAWLEEPDYQLEYLPNSVPITRAHASAPPPPPPLSLNKKALIHSVDIYYIFLSHSTRGLPHSLHTLTDLSLVVAQATMTEIQHIQEDMTET